MPYARVVSMTREAIERRLLQRQRVTGPVLWRGAARRRLQGSDGSLGSEEEKDGDGSGSDTANAVPPQPSLAAATGDASIRGISTLQQESKKVVEAALYAQRALPPCPPPPILSPDIRLEEGETKTQSDETPLQNTASDARPTHFPHFWPPWTSKELQSLFDTYKAPPQRSSSSMSALHFVSASKHT